jgi:hypothetical protein
MSADVDISISHVGNSAERISHVESMAAKRSAMLKIALHVRKADHIDVGVAGSRKFVHAQSRSSPVNNHVISPSLV